MNAVGRDRAFGAVIAKAMELRVRPGQTLADPPAADQCRPLCTRHSSFEV